MDRSTLDTAVRVELAIAMSGARLDLGEPERALQELDIPELDPDRAFEYSPGLFAARAAVLEELGRHDEAEQWRRRALVAGEALDAASGIGDLETVFVEEVVEEDDEPTDDEHVEDVPAEDETDADADEPAEDDARGSDSPGGFADAEASGADSNEASETPADDLEQPSVEDEVAEILIEAGVDEPADDEAER